MNLQNIATDWKPFGMQAGYIVGQQELDANEANKQMMERSALENIVKQRDAAFAQDEMNNPMLREMRMKGMIGENQTKAAQGQYDSSTIDGRIKAGLAEYAAKVPKAQLEQEMAESSIMLKQLYQLEGFGTQTGFDGLEFTTGAMRMAQQMGVPPQMVQQFQQANPQQRAEMIKAIRENLERSLTYIPAVLQDQAKETHKGNIQEKIHAGDRASREKVAGIQADAHRYSADKTMSAAEKQAAAANRAMAVAELRALASQYEAAVKTLDSRKILAEAGKNTAELVKIEQERANLDSAYQQKVQELRAYAAGNEVPTPPATAVPEQGTAQKPIKLD